jgi:integrase
MKLEANLAPGTIRKRVGALARALDWYLKRVAEEGKQPLATSLRMLPKNYSIYSAHERQTIEHDPKLRIKVDQERDWRLEPGEYERIVEVLKGAKREDRERPSGLPEGDALLGLFTLIVHTGLRLREAYTLRVEHVRLADRTIHLAHSTTGKRDVPIVPAIFDILTQRVSSVKSLGDWAPILPWWSGRDSEKELTLVSMRLSRAFARAFADAGSMNRREHDLRHEARCRWVLMCDANGAWMFRIKELMKITGHRNPVIFIR